MIAACRYHLDRVLFWAGLRLSLWWSTWVMLRVGDLLYRVASLLNATTKAAMERRDAYWTKQFQKMVYDANVRCTNLACAEQGTRATDADPTLECLLACPCCRRRMQPFP